MARSDPIAASVVNDNVTAHAFTTSAMKSGWGYGSDLKKMNALKAALEDLLSTKSPARKQAKTNFKFLLPPQAHKNISRCPTATPDWPKQAHQDPKSPPQINPRLDLHQEPPLEGING